MGRVWGPGSSKGAGAAAAKASSTPRPRAPPPAAAPSRYLSPSSGSSGKLPVERRCVPGSGPSCWWLFSKCWMMFLTLPGLTGRGQTMTGGCLPRDALPSSPGQGRQPAPRGEGRAPASRRQAPPGPCGAALGTAVPGPCLSAPAPPRAQSERVRKCVSCAGTFRLPRSLSQQLFSETVTRSFPRTTHKLKNSQKDQKHIYTKLGHVAKLRRAFPKSTSLSGFPLFSRDLPPVLSVPVVSGVKGSRLSLPGGVSEARSWALKFQPLPQARQRRPRQRGGQAGARGQARVREGRCHHPFWRPGPHVDLTAAGGGPVSPRRPGWLTTEPGTPSQKATRLRPLLPCP